MPSSLFAPASLSGSDLLADANLDRLSLLRLATVHNCTRRHISRHHEQETVDEDGYVSQEFRESECCLTRLVDFAGSSLTLEFDSPHTVVHWKVSRLRLSSSKDAHDSFMAVQRCLIISLLLLPATQGYPSSDDTWEPRSSLMEGAESILDAYIDKAARKGNVVPEDGARKKSKVAKLKADRPPSSKDSVEESSKRKKRESAAAEREAEEEEPPRKKKEKKAQAPVPVDIDSDEDLPAAPAPRKSLSKKEKVVAPPSPSPEPEPITAPAKKRKSTAGDKSRDFTDENVATASTSKTSKKDKSNKSVEIEKEKEEATASPGSVVFAREATWEVSHTPLLSIARFAHTQLTPFLYLYSIASKRSRPSSRKRRAPAIAGMSNGK